MSRPKLNIVTFPSQASAFVTPHASQPRSCLWVQSPAGHFMLLSGSWVFAATARLFATRCGYKLIDTEVGLELVDRQMNARHEADTSVKLH